MRQAVARWFAAAALAAPLLGPCTSANAQNAIARPATTTTRPPAYVDASQNSPKPATAQDDASHAGIKMHGYWKIDVRNPDGTLAEHREFENSLTNAGGQALIALMAGYQIPGDFGIKLTAASSGTGPCAGQSDNACVIVRSLLTSPGASYCPAYYCATGLTVTPNVSTSPYSLTLAGSITANQAGTIGVVYSLLSNCYNGSSYNGSSTTVETNAPSTCPVAPASNVNGTEYIYALSSYTLASPVSVSSGQVIQVSIVISFS